MQRVGVEGWSLFSPLRIVFVSRGHNIKPGVIFMLT